MCNTQSNVYLQSMKIYTLSVNTLTWNLTSERHDNCAPCLGLILPIRWVMPPPKFLFEVFHLASHLQSLRIWFVFNIDLTSCLPSQCCYGLILIYLYIRKQSNHHSAEGHEDILKLTTNQMWSHCNITPWVKHFKQEELVVALPTV